MKLVRIYECIDGIVIWDRDSHTISEYRYDQVERKTIHKTTREVVREL